MKYEYKTVTGKEVIEVDEHYYGLLMTLDNDIYNSDRKHERRHPIPLDDADYEGEWFSDGTDIPAAVSDSESTIRALSCLTEYQRHLVIKCWLEGWPYVDIAAREGVTEDAIRHALDRAKKNLEKFYRNPSGFACSRGYIVRAQKISLGKDEKTHEAPTQNQRIP